MSARTRLQRQSRAIQLATMARKVVNATQVPSRRRERTAQSRDYTVLCRCSGEAGGRWVGGGVGRGGLGFWEDGRELGGVGEGGVG